MIKLVLFCTLFSGVAMAQEMESLILAPSITPPEQPRVTIEQPKAVPTPKIRPPVTEPVRKATTPIPPRRMQVQTPAKTVLEEENAPINTKIDDAAIDDDVLILPTDPRQTRLNDDMTAWLDTNLLPRLGNDVEVMMTSYAAPTDISEISGRRLALSTGLLLREYLLTKGITPERINLKAVSAADNTLENTPENRIEFFIQE